MDKNERQNGVLKGKAPPKKPRIGRKDGFQRQAFWGHKKTLKLQEHSFWGLFSKQKKTRKEKQNCQTTKKQTKNTFLHVGKHPYFW